MGFKNVREYKLGIQGWRKRVKKCLNKLYVDKRIINRSNAIRQ